MAKEDLNEFTEYIGALKRKDRAGWIRHDVQNPESVAEHSWGVGVIGMVLAPGFGLDAGRVAQLGIIHDLAESVVPDYTPFDNISPENKYSQEEEAMKKIAETLSNGDYLMELWYEVERGLTPEGRFVQLIDKLEMMYQVRNYGIEQPDVNLDLFWERIEEFDFREVKEQFDSLKASRRID